MKKIKLINFIFIVVIISVSLSGCKKNDKKIETTKIETTSETKSQTIDTKKNIATESNSKKIETVDLQKYIKYQKNIDSFIFQLKLLQEKNLLDLYDMLDYGTSNKDIRNILLSGDYRYINNVTLKMLYDENKELINLEDRKGLIVFTKSNFNLEDESKKLSNKITGTEAFNKIDNKDISIDVKDKDCKFDSYIVFIFNDDNVLVGKFKKLLSEDGYNIDKNTLAGDLTYDVNIPLQISETSDVKTIYEKLDSVRIEQEKISKEIKDVENSSLFILENFYDKINNETNDKDFLKTVKENNLSIEKMNNIGLQKYNDKFLKNYELGYYIFLSKDEDKTSPDLRYNNNYIAVIFNEYNKFYYKYIITKNKELEDGIDVKNEKDYNLKELYNKINEYNETLKEYDEQKKLFNNYLDKNLVILNSKINYDYNYEEIINEIKKSGLNYVDNYNNKIIKEAKDKNNISISLSENDKNIYNKCIKVTSNTRDIYYFLNESNLIAIYRSDYFDISELSTNNYINLTTIKKGFDNLTKEDLKIKQELKTYQNMIDNKLKVFINSITFSNIKEKNKLTNKKDILVALDNSGFKYEEGMNKADGLYFIGIFANETDTKYSYKIYFNESEEVELIQ